MVPPGYIPSLTGLMCELVVDFVDMINQLEAKIYASRMDRFS